MRTPHLTCIKFGVLVWSLILLRPLERTLTERKSEEDQESFDYDLLELGSAVVL